MSFEILMCIILSPSKNLYEPTILLRVVKNGIAAVRACTLWRCKIFRAKLACSLWKSYCQPYTQNVQFWSGRLVYHLFPIGFRTSMLPQLQLCSDFCHTWASSSGMQWKRYFVSPSTPLQFLVGSTWLKEALLSSSERSWRSVDEALGTREPYVKYSE